MKLISFLLWVGECPNHAAKDFADSEQSKIERHKHSGSVSYFRSRSDPLIMEFGIQQIWHVMQASLAASIYAKEKGQVAELFKFLFRDMDKQLFVINGCRFLQNIFVTNSKPFSTPFCNVKVPTKFDVILFFHDLLSFHG